MPCDRVTLIHSKGSVLVGTQLQTEHRMLMIIEQLAAQLRLNKTPESKPY